MMSLLKPNLVFQFQFGPRRQPYMFRRQHKTASLENHSMLVQGYKMDICKMLQWKLKMKWNGNGNGRYKPAYA